MAETSRALLDRQHELFGLISRSIENLKKSGISNLTRGKVQSRLDNLSANWNKFQTFHETISKFRAELAGEDYFKSTIYTKCQEIYIDSKAEMLDLLDNIQKKNQLSSNSSNVEQPVARSQHLPRIDLPKFSGDYIQWSNFRDLFSSMVISNPELSSVEKLHYLKMSLTDEPEQLLKNISISGDNFDRAWITLTDRYENKRILIDSHLSTLFATRIVKLESSSELKRLLGEIKQSLGALESLQCPVKHWDNIIVFMAVRKLDTDSLKDWEKSIGSRKDPVTFEELETFVIGRIRSLEAIEQMANTRKNPNPHKNNQIKTHNVSMITKECSLCRSNHYVSACPQYLSKSPIQRKEFVIARKLCFNCLGPHNVKNCRSIKKCHSCNKHHHTTLHNTSSNNSANQSSATVLPHSQEAQLPASTSNVAHSHIVYRKPILLATAIISIISDHGKQCNVRALLDQGSEVSFISQSLVQLLRLPLKSANVPISGIGGNTAGTSRGSVILRFSSIIDPYPRFEVKTFVLNRLTAYLPPKVSYEKLWPHLNQLDLADPELYSNRPIDVVLGADVYSQILQDGICHIGSDLPVAQRTSLGWILSGPLNVGFSHESPIIGLQCSLDIELKDLIQQFWTQESSEATQKILSKEDIECENHFKQNYSRDLSGRFIVRLPLKNVPNDFGDSFRFASRLLHCMERRFIKNPLLKDLYSSFLSEYLNLNHMKEVPISKAFSTPHFFLPHHGVYRDSSSSTKLRVVFNGSQKTTSGVSLNDCLFSGPKLQNDLTEVLTRWRRHRIVFASDLEKMYRQILVNNRDHSLQQILWRESPQDPIKFYQLTTVTYGLSCAPFLAIRCLHQLAEEHATSHPLATDIILNDIYVDDILSGADDISFAKKKVSELINVLAAGGFTAKKWMSNNLEVLSGVSEENRATSSILPFEDNLTFRTLGLNWNQSDDSFTFDWKIFSTISSTINKRNVLSRIAQMYDPLGWLSPIIIIAKMFMQELWLQQIDWDTPLPLVLANKWKNFLQELEMIPTISIPRWLGPLSILKNVEIHGFSDASQNAYGAVVYCRVKHPFRVTLITAKSKVAPLKRITIPRLELCAAVLLTRITKCVLKTLKLSHVPVHLWCDSTIVLNWISNNPSRWKDFVQNRVAEIQEFSHAQWHHVSTQHNPADLVSRGVNPSKLAGEGIWWSGPEWLSQPNSSWPLITPSSSVDITGEERKVHCSVATPAYIWDLVNRYSNLIQLLRVTAFVFRFVNACKKIHLSFVAEILSPTEINEALMFWITKVQHQHFSNEIRMLTSHECLPRSSPLYRLCPFVDGNGFLRISGRLRFSNLSWDEKHPLIIPKSSPFTSLIISHHHSKTLHGGTQATAASIRQKFWILGGRVPIRAFIQRCTVCARHRARVSQQIMGQLPSSRVLPARPFLNTGVDYAGPFILRTFRGRGAKSYKGYLIVFVCKATSAVHLEMATDYTTAGFLAAYNRFTGRRGICATLWSDCGTNLIGADKELRALFKASSEEWKHLANVLANDGTVWRFNPPSAPHFGGKWEAVVKSTKYHLKRIIGNTALTYEEFTTLLIKIETILNSRPLCPLSDDPNSLDVLTPAHFLVGTTMSIIPEPSLLDINSSRLSRWQLLRKMTEQFWAHWSKHYLQYIQNRSKWFQPDGKLKLGSLVLIQDERYPPSKWPLARVTKLHYGPDDRPRVAEVKTSTTTLTRPISKLCLLPVES